MAEVQDRLNGLPDSDHSEERSMLTVEWLINRYLPDGGPIRTQGDYKKVKAIYCERIQHNIEHPPPPRTPPVQPEEMDVPGDIRHAIYAIYRSIGIPLGLVHDAFAHNYRALAAAKANGAREVVGMAAANRLQCCRVAHDLVEGRRYNVDDLLAAYLDPLGPCPVIPHPLCGSLDPGPYNDRSEPCCCSWLSIPAPAPGADPKFLGWMQGELERHKAEVLAQGKRAAAERSVMNEPMKD